MTVHADATPVAPKAAGPSRSLVVVTIALVVLAVVAMVVVILVTRAAPATYPPDSPEAAFQTYLTAFEDPDPAVAYAVLSSRVQAAWPYGQYVLDRDMVASSQQDMRVWIDSVERNGDRATLHLTIEFRSGLGLGASTWTDTRDIRMTLEDDGWRVDQRIVGVENL